MGRRVRISAPVELPPSQRDCALHLWTIQSGGLKGANEVYTCLRCGARFERTVELNGHHSGNGALEVPDWPTWDEIIAEP